MRAEPRTLLDERAIKEAVKRLGSEIGGDHPQGVVIVGVLKGSICLMADLARAIPESIPVQFDFLAISSYGRGGGRVRLLKDLDLDICGERVVLVEDIVDTGLTMTYVLGELRRREPASLEACVLIDRPARRIVPVDIRYTGFTIPDEYVIGYGLDHEGKYRNVRDLLAVDPGMLANDPDAYVESAFGE